MSWLKFLVPFGVSFMQSFLKEYNSPSPAGSMAHAAADAVVASGGVGNMRWVAVPHAQARAFKAAYPKARAAELFFKIFLKYERSDPEAYRFFTPFAAELAEMVEAHGHQCAFFVFAPKDDA